MATIAVLTRWKQIVRDGMLTNTLVLFDEVPEEGVMVWEDWTGQPAENIPPSPNLFIIGLQCDEATVDAIKAHGQYGQLAVLWEGDPSQSPVVTEVQYDAFANWLLNKAQNHGFPNATITHVYTALGGPDANGRTRYEIAQTLIAWLRDRPKA